ncbi:TetR/AcrR family transcriptional regulator [Lactiplantibacillus pentosus]|uniref:TetR/AcrR family transcriptional regulator n=1 Tax=Lactiplantibacillus pentosus TaxID=1589 RepID=UPI0031E9528F
MNPQERKQQNLTAIYEALLHLMSYKPLSMISITELCAHAQLSRSYFYRNFTSFDQIILTYQEQAILTYFRRLPRQSKITLPVLMTQYFTFMQQMAATNQLLIDNGKAQIIVQTFEAAYTLLIRHDRIITVTDSTIHHQPYYIAFFSGAVVNILIHWQQAGMVEPPSYLAQQIVRFTASHTGNGLK